MFERKNKRIQPWRLLSFSLVVLLFSLFSTTDNLFFQRLSAQPFTPLPEPKFPPPAKKVAWEDSFRKAETLRMNSPFDAHSIYLRISQYCTDSMVKALSLYRLAQSENQLTYAESYINKALELYPKQEDFLMSKADVLEKSFKYNEAWPIRSQLIRQKPRFISRYRQGIYTASMAGFEDSAEHLRIIWKSEFGGTPPEGFMKFKKTPLSDKTVQTVHNEIHDFETKILSIFSQREIATFIQLTEEFEVTYPFLTNHHKCHSAMLMELNQKCEEAKKMWHEISSKPDNIPSNYKSLQHLCP